MQMIMITVIVSEVFVAFNSFNDHRYLGQLCQLK